MTSFPSGLPCPLLSTNASQHGASFMRSNFEYAPRSRKVRCAKPAFSISFNLNQVDYDTFRSYYENDLNEGVAEFGVNWKVHGIVSNNKVVRFTTPYTTQELGNGYIRIAADLELLEKGA